MKFAFDEIQWGLSAKKDGSMKLLTNGQPDAATFANREKYFSRLGVALDKVVSSDLVHGNYVVAVTAADGGRSIAKTDGLVTNVPGLVLAATAADCVAVYFYDPERKAIGLAHAGWRGILKNIIPAVVKKMNEEYRSNPADLSVYIGPRIQEHHFEVKDDVAAAFAAYPDFIQNNEGKTFIDLGGVIVRELTQAGVPEKNIEISNECTFCEQEKYFSFRRDRPAIIEAMVAYIGIR